MSKRFAVGKQYFLDFLALYGIEDLLVINILAVCVAGAGTYSS